MPPRTPQQPDAAGEPPAEDDLGIEATEPLSLKDTAANALGGAMLGLDQALRQGPPPQIRAAEELPAEASIGGTDDLTIELPPRLAEPDEDHG